MKVELIATTTALLVCLGIAVNEFRIQRKNRQRREHLDAQWKRFFEYVEDVEPDKVPEYRLKAMRWGQG